MSSSTIFACTYKEEVSFALARSIDDTKIYRESDCIRPRARSLRCARTFTDDKAQQVMASEADPPRLDGENPRNMWMGGRRPRVRTHTHTLRPGRASFQPASCSSLLETSALLRYIESDLTKTRRYMLIHTAKEANQDTTLICWRDVHV